MRYVILILVFCSHATFAAPTAQEAKRYCDAYLNTPEAFKEPETYVCKTESEWSGNELVERRCFSFYDDMSDENREFAFVTGTSSCRSTDIMEVKEGNKLDYLDTANANDNFKNMGYYDKPLLYDNRMFETNGYDLRIVENNKNYILCEYISRAEEWLPAESTTPVCQNLERNNFQMASETTINLKTVPDFVASELVSAYKTDINNDGVMETLAQYEHHSGSGCGCSTYPIFLYYNEELIAQYRGTQLYSKDVPEELAALGQNILDITYECSKNVQSHVIIIDNRYYVLKEPILTKDGKAQDFFAHIQDRELYEYQNGKFEKICTQKADATRRIAHELMDEEQHHQLNYIPIE